MKEYLNQLIEEEEKEIVRTKAHILFWKKEMRNPTKWGVLKAQENLEIFKGHIELCQGKIKIYEDFARENGIRN